MVRTGVRLISAGIVALSIWFSLNSAGTQGIGPGNAGPQAELPGISVFGTIHPKIFRAPLGSQIPDNPRVRVASLETEATSEPAVEENEEQPEPPVSTKPCASFEERFFFGQELASFDDRFAGAVVAPDSAPARTAATEEEENTLLPLLALGERVPVRPEIGHSAQELAPSNSSPLPGARNDSNSSPVADSRTAIYDIAAHAVYLPNGRTLEAHSGLGVRLDDPRYVNAKGRGPTPPNVYHLALRERLFHGVRALRLIPVGAGEMFGRDGILAHSYMLGSSGQSNGCVAFSNYAVFLSAFLSGEVDRLVVVDHLATAPGPKTPSSWFSHTLKNLFTRS